MKDRLAKIVLTKKFKAHSDEMLKTAKIEPPLTTRAGRGAGSRLPRRPPPGPSSGRAREARRICLELQPPAPGSDRVRRLFRFQDLLERGLVEDAHAERLRLGELRSGVGADHEEAGLLRHAARHLGAELAQRVFGRFALQAGERAGDHERETGERQARALFDADRLLQ